MSNDGWDISYCGLNCAKCRMLENEECEGCRGDIAKCHSPVCEFAPCAKERGYEYCFDCSAFPCEKLEEFAADGHDHHRLAVENLKRMKEVGLEQWKQEQPKVMFCPGWLF